MGALDDGERVVAPDAATWRAWLEENHARSKGAWLVRPRPGSDLELVEYEDAILQALCFGWIDGPVRIFDEQHRRAVVRAATAVERVGGDEQGPADPARGSAG